MKKTQVHSLRDQGRHSKIRQDFSNHEVVTLAVYLLGGKSRYIDTEDVAVKGNKIAPGRFTWRKYPDQINLEIIRVYLSDAKKKAKGGYLIGSGTGGWLLTEKGLKFAMRRARDLKDVDLSREPLTTKEKNWRRSERARMLASNAYLKFSSGAKDTITIPEADSFFRVDDYVIGKAREGKISRFVNTFRNDPELGTVVTELAKKVTRR